MNFKMLLLLYLILTTDALNRKRRIIGGIETNIRKFPHHVSLRLTSINKHGCGGSIISKWNILTAAHCFDGLNGNYKNVKVYTGSNSSWSIYGKSYKITRVDIHPGYTGMCTSEGSYIHDIAVITLESYIEFNIHQNRIELPTIDIRAGVNAHFSGWGFTNYPAIMYSERLYQTSMSVLSKFQCQLSHNFKIHNNQFCAFQRQGVGLCTGDSGGALVSDDKIIGIASFVIPCARGYPDVFINVYFYLNFIRSRMIN